jgi:hypothetical protein
VLPQSFVVQVYVPKPSHFLGYRQIAQPKGAHVFAFQFSDQHAPLEDDMWLDRELRGGSRVALNSRQVGSQNHYREGHIGTSIDLVHDTGCITVVSPQDDWLETKLGEELDDQP